MAWASMHFATGMACGGAIATAGCAITRRGWRWIPVAMTVGGLWAMVPDMPRLFREDFPSLPMADALGQRSNEEALASNWFFFHRWLDEQPRELALHGLAIILALYNVAIAGYLLAYRRRRTAPTPPPELHCHSHEPPPDDPAGDAPADRTHDGGGAGHAQRE